MSFILDALKRSETERQQQAGAEFSSVPSHVRAPRRNRWLWLLAVLLGVNLTVLLGILLRPAANAPAAATPAIEPNPEEQIAVARETRTQPDFAEKLASARQNLPDRRIGDEAAKRGEPAVPAANPGQSGGGLVPPTVFTGRIPSIDELRLEGLIELPELHIDIHVYSDIPADRFVFINMNKQREASRLPAGPLVREIRPDGVVLEYRGHVFLLPRE